MEEVNIANMGEQDKLEGARKALFTLSIECEEKTQHGETFLAFWLDYHPGYVYWRNEQLEVEFKKKIFPLEDFVIYKITEEIW